MIGAAQMQLRALQRICTTRFAKTIHDPRRSVARSVAYADAVQDWSATADPAVLLQRRLNPWQLSAVKGVLFAAHPTMSPLHMRARAPDVVLLEGPPSTGKTQTIAISILNILHPGTGTGSSNSSNSSCERHVKRRVLVCAPSNCAVDDVLLRVRKLLHDKDSNDLSAVPSATVRGWKLLRVGVRSKVDSEVLRLRPVVYLDDCVSEEMERMGVQPEKQREKWLLRKSLEGDAVEDASVVFITLGSLHRVRKIAPRITFDDVIVDEASQGTEPAVLQALVLARSKCVLVGDSKQLQPTILSTDASRCGLRRSLLVRMLACGHKSFLLRTQYRMHPDICAFPNAYFYESKLETHHSVLQRSRTGSRTSGLLSDDAVGDAGTATIAQCLGQAPRFVFVDVPESAMERRRGRSLLNRREAAAVVQYMRQLRVFLRLSVRDMAPQLGIITFYNAQKDVILSMLTREERQSGLQVASVDSFQGKEKRVILLSCVRSLTNEHAGPGFLAHWNRLNVALTRAQDLCVCFCDCRWIASLGRGVAAASAAGGVSVRRTLTTVDSEPEEVVRQLDAQDHDPQALYMMLNNARAHRIMEGVCLWVSCPSWRKDWV
jgi:hypothetical protein